MQEGISLISYSRESLNYLYKHQGPEAWLHSIPHLSTHFLQCLNSNNALARQALSVPDPATFSFPSPAPPSPYFSSSPNHFSFCCPLLLSLFNVLHTLAPAAVLYISWAKSQRSLNPGFWLTPAPVPLSVAGESASLLVSAAVSPVGPWVSPLGRACLRTEPEWKSRDETSSQPLFPDWSSETLKTDSHWTFSEGTQG